MPIVFLATLGQRPEAITMALDSLLMRYPYERIGIMHTDAHASGIAVAYKALTQCLDADYLQEKRFYGLCHPNGETIIDIVDRRSAESYHRAVLSILKDYREEGWEVHLLIAGGRKAMSVYASLAASLLFSSKDRLWTILTEESLMQRGIFHVSAGMAQGVHLVALPFLPSRLLPGMLAERDVEMLIEQTQDARKRFMDDLSPQERALVEMLQAHPYVSNEEIAEHLTKSVKTIEKQLGSIYVKLANYFEIELGSKRNRQILMDVLAGRI
jgi:DNA-binding CsgD family transcriptional regulator